MSLQFAHLSLGLLQLLAIDLVAMQPGTRITPISPKPDYERDDDGERHQQRQ
jgi:hypothetical protein